MSLIDESSLIDVLRAARLVQSFVEGVDQGAFDSDIMCQSAVIHQLTIIGEATKRISQPFRNSYPASAVAANGWYAGCPHSCL